MSPQQISMLMLSSALAPLSTELRRLAEDDRFWDSFEAVGNPSELSLDQHRLLAAIGVDWEAE
jgi:hypothetical protein